jgi:hypothetical protein
VKPPKTSIVISISLPRSLVAAIDERARRENMNRSAWIAHTIGHMARDKEALEQAIAEQIGRVYEWMINCAQLEAKGLDPKQMPALEPISYETLGTSPPAPPPKLLPAAVQRRRPFKRGTIQRPKVDAHEIIAHLGPRLTGTTGLRCDELAGPSNPGWRLVVCYPSSAQAAQYEEQDDHDINNEAESLDLYAEPGACCELPDGTCEQSWILRRTH